MCFSVNVNYIHTPNSTTDSGTVTGSGPDTSENVAYGVTKGVLTTHYLAYDVVLR